MKDKIVFFILGALLATIAYLAGDLGTLTAHDETLELQSLRCKSLFVDDILIVGEKEDGATITLMTLDGTHKTAWIKLDGKSTVLQLNAQINAGINVDADGAAAIHVKGSGGMNSLQP